MKSVLIAGLVGMIFLAGGFFLGLRLAHLPSVPKKPVMAAPVAVDSAAPPNPITPESLQKASEGMMDLNKTLQARERDLATREQHVKQREDELDAERQALNRSHEKFNRLYGEFQDRLQLVEDNELAQLRRQVDLYSAMDIAQAVDLIHAQDDNSVIRLFSMTDLKVLSRMITQWKVKYPDEAPRLLRILNGMGRVLPKDKMTIADAAASTDSAASSSPSDAIAPAAATDGITNAAPVMPDPASTASAPATNAEAASAPPAPSPVDLSAKSPAPSASN